MYKFAYQKKQEKGEGSTAKAVGLGAGSLALYKVSKNPATGRVRVYHGTNKENAKRILEEGLDPVKGGNPTGATNMHGIDSESSFAKRTHGKSYVSRVKPLSNVFSAISSGNANLKKQPSPLHALGLHGGKTIKADIPYEVYERMQVDPDLRVSGNKKVSKLFAATTTEKINPEHIVGGKKNYIEKYKNILKGLPEYIKKHPGRFTRGVVGLGASGYLAHKAYKEVKK